MKPELLITTNGYKGTWSAIEYGVWLAEAMQLKVRLLGVTENLEILRRSMIIIRWRMSLRRAIELFEQKGIELQPRDPEW